MRSEKIILILFSRIIGLTHTKEDNATQWTSGSISGLSFATWANASLLQGFCPSIFAPSTNIISFSADRSKKGMIPDTFLLYILCTIKSHDRIIGSLDIDVFKSPRADGTWNVSTCEFVLYESVVIRSLDIQRKYIN